MESTWQGRYVCRQGVTGLTLQARANERDEVEAVFSFYGVPENPGVPSGSFIVTGVLSERATSVQLTPQRWLQRPPGYVMVGVEGAFDVPRSVMRGRVAGPGCQEFELRRVDQVAPSSPTVVAIPAASDPATPAGEPPVAPPKGDGDGSDAQAPATQAPPAVTDGWQSPSGLCDIEKVDWKNFAYPGFTLQNGSYADEDMGATVYFGSVKYSDLDGNGSKEAVVEIGESTGMRMGLTGRAEVFEATPDCTLRFVGRTEWYSYGIKARVRAPVLSIHYSYVKGAEPDCCPKGKGVDEYRIRDGKLVRTKHVDYR